MNLIEFISSNELPLKRVSDFRLTDVPAAVCKCKTCHKLFPSDEAVRQHLQSCIAIRQKPLAIPAPDNPPANECKHCGLHVLNIDIHLKLHLSSISGVIKCLYFGCRNSCFASDQLKNHMLCHRTQVKHYCPMCGRFFSKPTALYNHRHKELRKFTCQVPNCKFTGNMASDFKAHMFSTHGNNEGTCQYCRRDFKNLRALNRHLLKHKTDKRGMYSCVYQKCAKMTFTSIADLKIHVRSDHVITKKVVCDICCCSFASNENLAIHKNAQHAKKHDASLPISRLPNYLQVAPTPA